MGRRCSRASRERCPASWRSCWWLSVNGERFCFSSARSRCLKVRWIRSRLVVSAVKCAKNLPAYFAELLHDSMKVNQPLFFQRAGGRCLQIQCKERKTCVTGFFFFLFRQGGGTDESTLTRVMVSRLEIDLLDIRAEFKKLYENSLLSALAVSRTTSS